MATSNNVHISPCASKVKKLTQDREQLEKVAQSFVFNQQTSLKENLNRLSQQLINYFQIEGAEAQSLRSYLIQRNLPIEVTLRPIKPTQLCNLLQEWISLSSECSLTNQRLYTTNHRNQLFKSVLLEQKQTINDYFSINPNNMLIADDIFNLLQEILSPYFLYDSKDDSLTFFEKENSLLNFKKIVQKFAHNDHRILFSQSENSNYIRKLQFQKLIEFWESLNPELILLENPRKCVNQRQTQTDKPKIVDRAAQAYQPQATLIDFINKTMERLNKATRFAEQEQSLKRIQRIFNFLKSEKEVLKGRHNKPSIISKQQQDSAQIGKAKKSLQKSYCTLTQNSSSIKQKKGQRLLDQFQCKVFNNAYKL